MTADRGRCNNRGRQCRSKGSWVRHRVYLSYRRFRRRRHRPRRRPTPSSPSSAKPTAATWKPESSQTTRPSPGHSLDVSHFTGSSYTLNAAEPPPLQKHKHTGVVFANVKKKNYVRASVFKAIASSGL